MTDKDIDQSGDSLTSEDDLNSDLLDQSDAQEVEDLLEDPPILSLSELQMESMRQEVESLKDQFVRAQAELDNVKKRSLKDVESARKFALEKFASDILPVVDSLEKALEVLTGEQAQGVELTYKMFLDVLNRFNIEQLNPAGETFNPQYHEAMSMVPASEGVTSNTILTVLQRGYLLNGRLLRAAMVVVAK